VERISSEELTHERPIAVDGQLRLLGERKQAIDSRAKGRNSLRCVYENRLEILNRAGRYRIEEFDIKDSPGRLDLGELTWRLWLNKSDAASIKTQHSLPHLIFHILRRHTKHQASKVRYPLESSGSNRGSPLSGAIWS
jgi:hypothetical protein